MNSEPTPTPKFQISLKWLLIGFTLLGSGIGLLARAFSHQPEVFRIVLGILSTIVPFMLAIGTIFRLSTERHSQRLRAWALFLIFMPICGFSLLFVASQYIGNSPGGLGVLTNTKLINQRLPPEFKAPWVWRELTERLQNNSLSKTEVNDAFRLFIAHMKTTKPQGWDQPLHWSKDFLVAAQAKKMISNQIALDLADAFYGTEPKLEKLSRIRAGQSSLRLNVNYGNTWSVHSKLPLKLIWSVNQVFLDGKPIKIREPNHHSQRWSGNCRETFSTGEHELTLELDCAYIDTPNKPNLKSGAIDVPGPEVLRSC